jgi:hypothetical protein
MMKKGDLQKKISKVRSAEDLYLLPILKQW